MGIKSLLIELFAELWWIKMNLVNLRVMKSIFLIFSEFCYSNKMKKLCNIKIILNIYNHNVLKYLFQLVAKSCQWRRHPGPYWSLHTYTMGQVLVGIVPAMSWFTEKQFTSRETVPGYSTARYQILDVYLINTIKGLAQSAKLASYDFKLKKLTICCPLYFTRCSFL